MQAELAVDCTCELGEGPVWDAAEGSLIWVDIDGRAIYRYWPDSGKVHKAETRVSIGAFALREQGGAVAAGAGGFYFLDIDTGELQPIADPEAHLQHNRFNDGKCDPAGRFLAGTLSKRDEPEAAFYTLDPDLHVRKNFDQVKCSNGIAWSPDGRTMYYIDSMTRKVAAYDYDMATGELSAQRIVIHFEDGPELPDGMTVDREGMLWIAEWDGWGVSRWNPNTGKRLARIKVPSQFVTSCAFAGEGSDLLYITTARQGLSGSELSEQPHSGGLFRVRTGVEGTASFLFRG
ncbi:SMP-30/gluconolactonase/LRE family protein [Cohnella silvisoli]|uniref:Regucalcin n=1 Tax=Cohnella silvisoli TaxID=2873699 RepID=A0ABV1KT02_9BACL|nr:SMP-30/gluconolactonase/LRE family protein [Cohnella silvisoli]MCD9021642.1 SMP-30/gluconolactonase/LRE family protein [Cohnella silvisoli]